MALTRFFFTRGDLGQGYVFDRRRFLGQRESGPRDENGGSQEWGKFRHGSGKM